MEEQSFECHLEGGNVYSEASGSRTFPLEVNCTNVLRRSSASKYQVSGFTGDDKIVGSVEHTTSYTEVEHNQRLKRDQIKAWTVQETD